MAANKMDVDPYKAHWGALYSAVLNRQPIVISHLLRQNGHPHFTDENGNTALHLVFHIDPDLIHQPTIVETLKILLDHGMNPNVMNKEGKTVLHLAIHYRMKDAVDLLIERGADLNICDADGDSTAHFLVDSEFDHFSATCWSHHYSSDMRESQEKEGVSFVNWLITKGLNLNYRNNEGMTPAHLAAQLDFQHILLELLKHTNDLCMNYANRDNQSILHTLTDSQTKPIGLKGQKARTIPFSYPVTLTLSIIQLLLNKGISVDVADRNGNTPLHLAAKQSRSDLIELMLDKFTNVDARDLDGNTLLHAILINSCKTNMINNREKFVRALLSKRSNVHIRNNAGYVPIQIAVSHHNEFMARLLQRYNADFNVTHNDGNLLHLLTRYEEPTLDKYYSKTIVDLLISRGCDVNGMNSYGYTPLHLAMQSYNVWMVERLIEHGADLRVKQLADRQFTTLHLAVEYGYDEDFVNKCIDCGIDVNVRDARGRTPLHIVSAKPEGKNQVGILSALMDRGAYVDTYDYEGNLPLHMALRSENVEGVKKLIEHGADINDRVTLCEIESLILRERIADVILTHWMKLKLARLPAMNGFARCLDMYYEIKGLEFENETLKFRHSCENEIVMLKAKKIDGNVSWYNFLHMNLNRRCAFVRENEDIHEKIFRISFPLYDRVISCTYYQVLARMPLLKNAMEAWYKLTNYYIPDMCVEIIFSNLSNANLRDIIESVKYRR